MSDQSGNMLSIQLLQVGGKRWTVIGARSGFIFSVYTCQCPQIHKTVGFVIHIVLLSLLCLRIQKSIIEFPMAIRNHNENQVISVISVILKSRTLQRFVSDP